MKKIVLFAFMCLSALSLTACMGSDESSDNASTDGTTVEQPAANPSDVKKDEAQPAGQEAQPAAAPAAPASEAAPAADQNS